jgi:hypothetical protein
MCWEGRKRVKKANQPDPPTFSSSGNTLSGLPSRAKRLGIDISSNDFSSKNSSAKQQLQIKLNKYHENLLEGIEDVALLESILNSKPQPYPTVQPMHAQERRNMVILGRMFELLMLNIQIKSCCCCGSVAPVQHGLLLVDPKNKGKAHDPLTGAETKLKRHHLVNPFTMLIFAAAMTFAMVLNFMPRNSQLKLLHSMHIMGKSICRSIF